MMATVQGLAGMKQASYTSSASLDLEHLRQEGAECHLPGSISDLASDQM